MPWDDYLIQIPVLLEAADEELYSLGLPFSHRHPPPAPQAPTQSIKKIFGDLKSLFGEATYRGYRTNDPIAADTWWRRRVPAVLAAPPAVILPPIILPPAAPAAARLPDTVAVNTILWDAVTATRRRGRNRWVQATDLFSQNYGVRYPLKAVKNRHHVLQNRGW